ncbi:type I-F CRISPR-associated endoribonuclease Cas6/Csy4 [Vibrio diazotrophicus]|uniref:type I-F CRISPR-associated endoribonuclease Cas6/Csy4 n=1 Tax=Vibrio diazotrophicus TaxID=685 RepID=UPI000C9DD3B2|nr:type I-F CRISPR-associated endoribonuclease Cas6/Csy4 [Vibrio diazotrophicus]PNH79168.1 type I-F CRISPR-associated endoribonuclease Cas6/Csy4 [Vibrio diazotrophicus]
MNWYYRTITFLPEYRNNEALAAKCIKELHSFNYKYSTRSIGISFPLWTQETIGRKLTFVSTNKMELDFLISRTYFNQMVKLSYFSISNSRAVPEDCSYALFSRKQSIDKSTSSGLARKLKRLGRRALERGETFNPALYSKNVQIEFQHYHSLEEESSSGDKFSLRIQMNLSVDNKGKAIFSSYGLGNSEGGLRLVPLI